MGFRVLISTSVLVESTGRDRLLTGRRRIEFDAPSIQAVDIRLRSELEATIDHRSYGIGTHDGAARPDRRRVGSMYGRGVAGKQFWAVAASPGSTPLVVVDLRHGEFSRAVLMVDDPQATADAITAIVTRSRSTDAGSAQ